MFTTRSLINLLAAAALSLTACAAGDDAGGDGEARVELDDAAAQTTTTAAAPEAAPVTTVQAQTLPPTTVATPEATTVPQASAATIPDTVPPTTAAPAPEPTPVVASLQVNVTNTSAEGVPLVIDLTTADRSNGRVEIKFDVTNVSADASWRIFESFGDPGPGGDTEYVVDGVSLIDLVNNQRYLVLLDSEGGCVCSTTVGDEVGPGQTISYQASLPAPPDDVTVVDVQLGGVTLFTDVTLTDR